MKKVCIALFLALLVNTAPSALLNPGIVFEVETTDHEQSPPRVGSMEIIVEGPNLAIPIAAGSGRGGAGKVIFRGDRGSNGELVIVDDDAMTYMVIGDQVPGAGPPRGATPTGDASDLGAAFGALAQAFGENLTQEQRDALARLGGGLSGLGTLPAGRGTVPQSAPQPGAVSETVSETGVALSGNQTAGQLRAPGDTSIIAGRSVVWFVASNARGMKTAEGWTAPWGEFEGGDEARDAFTLLGAFLETLPRGATGGPTDFWDQMNFEAGFPVSYSTFGDSGDVEEAGSLRSTRRQRLDPAAFEPPSGYKRMSMGPF